MENILVSLNTSLRNACNLLEVTHAKSCRDILQSGDILPDPRISELAADTVNLSDRLQRILQPPSSILAESFLAYIDTKCLWSAVSNDIPEKVSAGYHKAEDLASISNIRIDGLRKVMNILCENGIFRHNPEMDEYHHTAASELLDKQHWTQWHNWTDLYGNEFYDIFRSLPRALKINENRSAAQLEFSTDLSLFDYFQSRGLAEKFHRTLGGAAIAQAPGVVADYDWATMGRGNIVLDIGGGAGDFLAALLRAHSDMKGAVLDLEHVVQLARQNFNGPGAKYGDVAERMVDFHIGDFTLDVPVYEMYVIKWCLHNWNDEMAVKILSNIRRAIKHTLESRLVIIEGVLAPGRSSRVSRYADITMMVAVSGKERTKDEWEKLVGKSGWRIESISTLRNAWCCAIDLRPI